MRSKKMRCWKAAVLVLAIVCVSDPLDAKINSSSEKGGSASLQQRIDFGNSYIMGQSIKSGAVYLMHRKQNEIKSMLEYRNDYRDEILEDFQIQNLIIDGTKENANRSKK